MKRYDGAFLSEWDKGRWVEYSDVEVLEKENELLRKQIQCDSVDEGCNLYEETGVVCYRHLHHFYETASKQIKENHDRAEEIIKGREKTIAHLHEQLAEKEKEVEKLIKEVNIQRCRAELFETSKLAPLEQKVWELEERIKS